MASRPPANLAKSNQAGVARQGSPQVGWGVGGHIEALGTV